MQKLLSNLNKTNMAQCTRERQLLFIDWHGNEVNVIVLKVDVSHGDFFQTTLRLSRNNERTRMRGC